MSDGIQHIEKPGLLEIAKHGLLGAFFKVRKDMRLGSRFFYLSTVINLAQLCYFPIVAALNMPWPDFIQQQQSMSYVVPTVLVFENEWIYLAFAGAASMWILLSCIGIIALGFDELHGTSNYDPFLYPIEILLRFGHSFVLIPFVVILSRFSQCDPSFMSICSGASSAFLRPFAWLMLLLFSFVTCMSALFLYRGIRFGENMSSRKLAAAHGRVEMLSVVLRVALSFVLGRVCTTAQDSSFHAIWSILLLVTAVVLLTAYIRAFPYVQISFNRSLIVVYSIFLWEVVALIVTLVVNDANDMSARIVFVGSLPFFIFTVLSMSDDYIHHLKHSDSALRRVYEVEIRLRLHHLVHDDPSYQPSFEGQAEEDYRAALAKFPESAYLRLYIAELVQSSSKKIMFSLGLIREARHRSLSWDLDFVLFSLNKRNEERQHESNGAASFMKFDFHLMAAKEKLHSALQMRANFWDDLRNSKFSTDEIIKYGTKIHAETELCKYHISRILKISNSNGEAIKMQAIYINCILNDPLAAMKLLDRHGQNSSTTEDQGFAVATVSGSLTTLGHIIDITQSACALFGYKKNEMVGRNINFLCPPPFDRVHDMFLMQFLSSEADFETKSRVVYGLHQNGHIFPMEFVITPSTNASSDLILIGKFQGIADAAKCYLLVDQETMIITASCKHSVARLNLDPADLFSQYIYLEDILPDFFEQENQDSKYYTYSEENTADINGNRFHVEATKLCYDPKDPEKFKYKCNVILITIQNQQKANRELTNNMSKNFSELASPKSPSSPQSGYSLGGSSQQKVSSKRRVVSQRRGSIHEGSTKLIELAPSIRISLDQGTVTSKQMHKIVNSKLQKRDPILTRFKLFAKLFVFVFIGLGIIATVLDVVGFNNYKQTMSVWTVARSRITVLSRTMSLQEMWRQPVLYLPDERVDRIFPNVTQYLNESLGVMKEVHLSLVEDLGSYPEIDTITNTPLVSTTSDGITFKNASLNLAYLAMTDTLESFLLSEVFECSTACRYLLNNGMFDIFSYSLKTLDLYSTSVHQSLSLRFLQYHYFKTAGLIILIVSLVYGFIPMFRRTENMRAKVAQAFVSISPATMTALQERAYRRMECVSANEMTQLFHDGKYAPKSNLTNGYQEKPGVRKSVSRFQSLKRLSFGNLKDVPVLVKDNRVAKVFKFFRILLVLGILCWVVLIFLGISNIAESHKIPIITAADFALMVAGYRAVFVGAMHFWSLQVPNGTQYGGFRADYTDQAELVNDLYNNIASYNHALRYGNVSLGLNRGYSGTNRGSSFEIDFEDACFEDCLNISALSSSRNQSADLKILVDMTHGLNFAIEEYLNFMLPLQQARTTNSDSPDSLYQVVATFDNFEAHMAFIDSLNIATSILVEDQMIRIDEFITFRLEILVMFAASMLVAYIFTSKMITRMDRQLKSSQTLMFMLPIEVIAEVPEMKKLVFGY